MDLGLFFSQLAWRAPAWGLLPVIPLALAGLAWRRRHRLLAYAEAPLRPWALAGAGPLTRWSWRAPAWWLAWLCLAVAAAGPRLPLDEAGAPGAAPRHRLSLLVAVDVSASMAAADIAPDRLSRARLELADLLARLRGERVGLLAYAGQAGLLLPPSDDPSLVESALAQLDPDLIEQPGSRHAAALELALNALGAGPYRAVLLLTDGEADSLSGEAGEQARAAAARLKQAGIPLYILGLGSAAGAPIPLADGGFEEGDGRQVISTPDRDGLAALARSGGGRFAPVADGDGDWAALYDDGIAALPGAPVPPERARAWRELFTGPLALALLLFMVGAWPTRRPGRSPPSPCLLPQGEGKNTPLPLGGSTLTGIKDGERAPGKAWLGLLVCVGLLSSPPQPAQAVDGNLQQQAYAAYKGGRHGEAQHLYARQGGYPGHMGAGAAAWFLKDYTAAARHFGAALLLARTAAQRADALYNLGNAHYGLGRWAVAVEAFQAVLALRPNDARAAANLAVAEARLKKAMGQAPMRSDLKGRRGALAEGEINLDWDRETAVREFEPDPDSPLLDREKRGAMGARLAGEAARARQVELDARRLESGLRKLPLLQDQPRVLLQGLLKQDRPATGTSPELPPW